MHNTGFANNKYPDAAQGAQNIACRPREDTQLESVLHRLLNLREGLASAADRHLRLTERLLGSEPLAPASVTEPGGKDLGPLLPRLEQAANDLQHLAETLHHHLSRLERL